MIKNQFERCVKVFRSDNGGEFLNSTCHDFFVMHGIIYQRSCPHTPQQNRVVERKHRHLLETARAIKFQGCLPDRFWGECVEAATYIINRVPLSVLGNKSPYEMLYHKPPSLAHIRVIGCLAFATNLKRDDKFSPKARKAVLLGYLISQKGYKLVDVESKLVFVSRDVIFFKDKFSFQAPGLVEVEHYGPLISSHTEDALTPCVIFKPGVQNVNETREDKYEDPSSLKDNEHGNFSPCTSIDQPHTETHTHDDHSQAQNEASSVQPDLVDGIPPIVARRSTRHAKPSIWHTDYILTKLKTTSGNCF